MKKPKPRQVVDPLRLIDNKEIFQYMNEKNPDRIFIIGSLGPKLGYPLPEYSLEPLCQAFKAAFEQEVSFKPECEFGNFAQMLEDGEFPEGATTLLENLNFNPSEHGFIFNQEEKKLKLVSSKQQELFKERLSSYSKLYVNDAPIASLTESASINGISTTHMLLGVKTKEMLNTISSFFMYSGYPFAGVLGGTDIKDKILLISSLIDTATQICLFGDIGLYFLAALGIKIANYTHDDIYDEAIIKLVKKAQELGVEIILPVDFVVIKKRPKKAIQEEKKEDEPVPEKKKKKERRK